MKMVGWMLAGAAVLTACQNASITPTATAHASAVAKEVLLTEQNAADKSLIRLSVGDQVSIHLRSNPSTGYA